MGKRSPDTGSGHATAEQMWPYDRQADRQVNSDGYGDGGITDRQTFILTVMVMVMEILQTEGQAC